MAATHFYRTPPTGKTFPLKVISPVIERLSRTGIFSNKETRQVTIVTPADGPSFFIPPAGKCRCKVDFSISSIWSVFASASPPHKENWARWAFIQANAIYILSFITSPSCPVTSSLNLSLGYLMAYTNKSLPPISVQAIPFTTPRPPHISFLRNGPNMRCTFSISTICYLFSLATFRHILEIFLSNCLTPI
jgi:hypothetical protein